MGQVPARFLTRDQMSKFLSSFPKRVSSASLQVSGSGGQQCWRSEGPRGHSLAVQMSPYQEHSEADVSPWALRG